MDAELREGLKNRVASPVAAPSPVPTPTPTPAPVVPSTVTPPASTTPVVMEIPGELLGIKETPPVVPPAAPAVPAEISDAEIAALPPKQQNVVKQQRDTIRQLHAKIEAASKTTPTPANTEEVTQLKALLDQTAGELEKVALERSPLFHMKFNKAKAARLDQIKTYLKDFGIADDKVAGIAEKAATLSLKDRMSLLSEEAPDIAPALLPLFSEIDQIERNKAAELANAKTASKQYQDQLTERTKQFRTKHMQDAIDAAKKDGHFLLQEIPGNEAWNTSVKAVHLLVQEVFNVDDPTVQARAAVQGAMAPMYLNIIKTQAKDLQAAKAELAKYRRVIPTVGGDHPAGDGGGGKAPAMSAEAAGQMAARRLVDAGLI